MKIKPIMIPDVGIQWDRPITKTTTHTIEMTVDKTDKYQTEVVRLEAKYGRVLSKKEVAHELNISPKTLERRIISCEDLPEYIEQVSGRVIFPISSVATYLSQGLVRTL